MYHVSKNCADGWIKKAHSETDGKNPGKDELARLYWKEGISTERIGAVLGVHPSVVREWFAIYRIPLRKNASPYPGREKLEELYLEEYLNPKEIAGIYKVSYVTVYRWLHKAGLTCKTGGKNGH